MNAKHFLRAVIAILSLAVAVPASAQCTGDLTGNGIVDGADLGTVLAYWGPRSQDPTSVASDLDGNGLINGADLGLVLNSWGPCQSTITSITPNQGCIVGGTQITITGTYLGSTSAVTIGGVPATSFTVMNQSTVQATTPAGAAGPVNVQVTTAAGTTTVSQHFTYMPASVSSIVPNQGAAAGGMLITITGTYLGLTTSATIGGTPCTDLTVVNSGTVTARTPPGVLGDADVVIMGAKGAIVIPGAFRFVPIVVPAWAKLVEAQPDPELVVNPALRAAIVATGYAWRVEDIGTGAQMMLIPPGTFKMGCIMRSDQYDCDSSERPVHEVTLTNAFYLGRYEVTQAQWVAKMGSNPSYFQGQADSTNKPVETVSWNAVQSFLSITGMRLPTEAEWEYACRAGIDQPFYNGSTDVGTVGDLAWFGDGKGGNAGGQTHAVGGKKPNGFGLYDMLGNVWEWVSDRQDWYPNSAQTNPTGPMLGDQRVVRGGAFDPGSARLSSSARSWGTPGSANPSVGFRVARNP
jgi:formylglycine-generating enzyme required for sulfatase activity